MASERPWFPISSGLLTWEHYQRLGQAWMVFHWMIHEQRQPKDGEANTGVVRDGVPISYEGIGARLQGMPAGTVKRHVALLEREGYIRSECVRGEGKRYFVNNPIRWTMVQRISAPSNGGYGAEVSRGCSSEVSRSTAQKCSGGQSISAPCNKEQEPRTYKNKIFDACASEPSNPPTELEQRPDPRHGPIRSLILKWHLEKFRANCEWTGREGKVLNQLLADNPSWSEGQLSTMVRNRFQSDGITSARPGKWIPDLGSYLAGPLDQFNRVKGEYGNQLSPQIQRVKNTYDLIHAVFSENVRGDANADECKVRKAVNSTGSKILEGNFKATSSGSG